MTKNPRFQSNFYVSSWQECLQVLFRVGVIIFWLLFWLPRGINLVEMPALSSFGITRSLFLPISLVGLLMVSGANFLTKEIDKKFWGGVKLAFFWLLIFLIISFFSRDFSYSSWGVLVLAFSMLIIPIRNKIITTKFESFLVLIFGLNIGFLAWIFYQDLGISLDLLSAVSLWALILVNEKIFEGSEFPAKLITKETFFQLLIKTELLLIVIKNPNPIFTILALAVLIFCGKLFIFRRGSLKPDYAGIIIFCILLLIKIFSNAQYGVDYFSGIPHFWSNFREILFGVGVGQFLPALESQSSHLIIPSTLSLPNSSFWLTVFEQGVFGVLGYFFLFLFAHYLAPKRSSLYIFMVFILWSFSSVFVLTPNGMFIFFLLLFFNFTPNSFFKNPDPDKIAQN